MRVVLREVFLLLLCGVTVLGAQSGQAPARDPRASNPAQDAGLLAGTVIAADTGQPVPGARVMMTGAAPPLARSATTDAQGRFAFESLPAGTYTVTASRAGYVESIWGQRRPGSGRPGTPLQFAAGQQIKNFSLPIAKGGVITGMIVDEFGFPAAGTSVRVYRAVFRNGERALQQAGTGQTDDRGVYRVYGLLPGEYAVVATPRASGMQAIEMAQREAEVARMAGERYAVVVEKIAGAVRTAPGAGPLSEPAEGYAPVYYPGTTVASMATRVALDVSEEKSGVDIALQVVPLARISGVVTGVSPLPPSLTVYLTEQGPLTGLGTKTARVGPDGRFSMSGVTPGQYSLTVRAALRPAVAVASAASGQSPVQRIEAQPAQWMWAIMDLNVSGQSHSDIVLMLAPGLSIGGSVAFRGASPPPDLSRVRLSFLPIGLSSSAAEMELASGSARVDAQGRFTAVGLMPGRYRVTASAPGWALASVSAQGREVLDAALDLKAGEDVAGMIATFSDQVTTLTGSLQQSDGAPAVDYTVVVFASDSQFWTPFSRRIQATRPSSGGHYSFRNLPAGEYRLAAVIDPEPGQWLDPEFLRTLVPASTTVRLADGEARTQDLRIGR